MDPNLLPRSCARDCFETKLVVIAGMTILGLTLEPHTLASTHTATSRGVLSVVQGLCLFAFGCKIHRQWPDVDAGILQHILEANRIHVYACAVFS